MHALLRSQPERPDDALPERVKVLLTALAVRLAAVPAAVDRGSHDPRGSGSVGGEARAKDSEGGRESTHVAPPRTETEEMEDPRVALGDAPPALALQVLAAVCTPALLRAGPHAAAFASLAHGAAVRSGDATTTLGGASQASPSSSDEPPADTGGTPQRGTAARAARADQAAAASPRSVALVTWVRGATHADDDDAAAVESLLCTALQLDLPAAAQSAADRSTENAVAAVVEAFPSGDGGGESGSIAAAAAAAACVRPWVKSRVEAGRGLSAAVRDALVARCIRTVSRLGPVACDGGGGSGGGGGGGSGGGGVGGGGGGAGAGGGGGVGVEVQTEAHVPSAPLSIPAGVSSAWVAAERCAAAAAVLEAVRTLTVLCATDPALPPRCLASLTRLQVRAECSPGRAFLLIHGRLCLAHTGSVQRVGGGRGTL